MFIVNRDSGGESSSYSIIITGYMTLIKFVHKRSLNHNFSVLVLVVLFHFSKPSSIVMQYVCTVGLLSSGGKALHMLQPSYSIKFVCESFQIQLLCEFGSMYIINENAFQ